MEVRRMRRFGRGRSNTLLPLHVTHLSNTISCCYCEFKSSSFNQPLFLFGRKYSRNLGAWFSIGVGFSLTAVVGVSMILIWESARVLHLYNGNTNVISLLSGSLFGVSPWVSGFSVSFANAGYMLIASIISVCTHEVGHALAAASEGVQMEYAAVFLAVLFPGALVAFNHELLQVLSRVAALRIYCAGIWHNAAFCAVCALILFCLPLILYPFFLYNENPMVLDVSSSSPLHGYLSTGDLIITLDGIRVRKSEEWTKITALLDEQTNSQYPKSDSNINIMGYCVPISLINENNHIQIADNKTTCPNELNLFTTTSCLDSTIDGVHCLPAKDIVTLNKCQSAENNCTCSEDESCSSPVQMPGSTWVEIKYSTPYPPKCHRLENKLFQYNKSSDIDEINCGGTFVFIGDIKSMSRSIMLTFYRPRWSSSFGANFPNMLEKLLIFTFNVSLTLALLNSLPVYFLDGESILEMTLCFFSSLSPRQRGKILQSCLLGGTTVSILIFLRISFLAILQFKS